MEPIAARACADRNAPMQCTSVWSISWASRGGRTSPFGSYAAHYATQAMQMQGPIRTWVVDDTGFLKQGMQSPGVQRQYTGSAGKTTNCQIGVSLVLATEHAHVATDFRLYLPESWTDDRARCRKAHIPDDIDYAPMWALALDMIEGALRARLPKGAVLADADYGTKTVFRDMLHVLGLQYAVAVQSTIKLRVIGTGGVLGERMTVEDVGQSLQAQLRTVTWREGTKTTLRSRFARVRVVVNRRTATDATRWLLGRVAAGQIGTDEVRAVDAAGEHLVQADGSHRQESLAYRAVLRGPQRRARPGPLRRRILHRMASSRQRSACLLRFPGRRARAIFSPSAKAKSRHRSGQPTRPERHFHDSLITLRIVLVREILVRWLPRCPCCLRDFQQFSRPSTRAQNGISSISVR